MSLCGYALSGHREGLARKIILDDIPSRDATRVKAQNVIRNPELQNQVPNPRVQNPEPIERCDALAYEPPRP